MKACIVTVYNSTNCGSYLQAYALRRALERAGAEVCFLKTGVKNNNKIFLRKALRNIKRRRMSAISFDYKVLKNFNSALKRFNVVPAERCGDVDLYVLGSDEIWNASRDIMRGATVFWGDGLDGRKISYAPSVNTSTKEDIAKIGNVRELLAGIARISVRDGYSKSVISELTDKDIEVLCDPTFLLRKEDYDEIEGKCPESRFVLVYSAGGRFEEKDIENIRSFARKNNCKTVAFPHNLKWCDSRYPADPFDAVAFFRKASYVITDTFHGAALSLIFNKRFAAIPKENTKVRELLGFFGLNDMIREDSEGLTEFFADMVFPYEELNARFEKEREKATEFIGKALTL